MRHGHAVVRLVPVEPKRDVAGRRALMEAVHPSGASHRKPSPSAARIQDDLYDEDGLPG